MKLKKKYKKYILAIIIFAIIAGIVLFFVINDGGPGEDTNNPAGNVQNSNSFKDVDNIAAVITVSPYPNLQIISDNTLPFTPQEWVTGDNPKYKIQFPPDWKATVSAILDEGVNVAIQPKSNDYFPRITIEYSPIDRENSIEDKITTLKEFIPLSYSELKTSFRGLPATQVSEILPIGDMQNNPLHKTYLFFNTDTLAYVVTLAYFQDQNADESREMLLQILNSLKLK